MAPGKKKKKAANPARGFATTSLPSKPKPRETAEDVNDEPRQTSATEGADYTPILPVSAILPENDALAPPNIQDMAPDQLETYLEDVELQTLLDTNSARCKSDATRQISKLRNEIRQYRTQCYFLSTYGWLNESTMDKILTLPTEIKPGRATPDLLAPGNHKTLLNLWILEQVLSTLEFPTVHAALASVLRLAATHTLNPDSSYVWGLVEAFDWYALNVPLNKLPEYQTSVVTGSKNTQHSTDTLALKPKETNTPAPGERQTPTPPGLQSSLVSDDAGGSSQTESPELSSHDDENDPIYLIEKCVQLKTKLWKLEHGDSESGGRELTNGTRVEKLRTKISNIERDILFNKEESEKIWMPIAIRLEAEENLRRRTRKKLQPNPARTSNSTPSQETKSLTREAGSVTPQLDEEDNANVFGTMFTVANDVDDNQPHPLLSNIRIVDFGSPTGMKPRQLLEHTCRGIDAGSLLKTSPLQQTSYSNRHQLELFWSTTKNADKHAIEAASREVTIVIEPQHWTLEMRQIAGVTSEQSISYASAVMLFLVSTVDGQENQISLRLAGAWRELFVRLFDVRKEVTNTYDKMDLKELRGLIDLASQFCKIGSNMRGVQKGMSGSQLLNPSNPVSKFESASFKPDRARQEWESRASSQTFKNMLKIRQQLPIHDHKGKILQTISENPVCVICAETGSGKSTQCGTFVLEQQLSSGQDCRIMITQPRRISAISLARRVSQELGESFNAVGTMRSLVGYSIRLESKTSSSTRLTFATTGVLLRMLESSPMLEQLNYLILDEVHERTLETDLLFVVLRELLKKRSDLKIVLMSATVNARLFSDYFGGAPILDIPGRTFPIEVKFLEDVLELTNDISDEPNTSVPQMEEVEIDDDSDDQPTKERTVEASNLKGYSNKTRKRLENMDEYRINYPLIVKLAVALATKREYARYSPAILIFMPGMAEIRRLHRALLNTDTFSNDWQMHLLHSSFSTEDLERAFSLPPPGVRKIVISTNIAETGITIPDVTAVIDTCKEKMMRYNERRQLSKLSEAFISRSAAKQRRGRAARVQKGICFHLVTKYHFDHVLQEQSIPEILRLSLQDPILRVKVWNFGSAEETLSAAISPPPTKSIVRAIEKLREAGALTGSEELTPLGEQVARLPLDVSLAKLAVLGANFGCLDPVLAMISILTSKSPFVNEMACKNYFDRANSDLISALSAYQAWKRARLKGSSFEFCRKNWLSEQYLTQIEEQKLQLFVYLVDGGQVTLTSDERLGLNRARFIHTTQSGSYDMPERFNKSVSDDLLLSLISMAFYPRILTREGNGWRNVYTNQQVSLAKRSVNGGSGKRARWLSFFEAMQARPGNLNVYETSRVPEAALALLLGQMEVKMFSGVLSIDSGKIRLAVGNWKQAMVIKRMRSALLGLLDRCHRRPGKPLSETDQQYLELFVGMMTVEEVEVG